MTVPHAFAVAAYGRSPHLEDCLRSLRAQSVQSPIVISTSTPHEGLAALAQCHGVALRVHGENRGIGADWNAALRATDAQLVTIAHQDDLYAPGFTAAALNGHGKYPDSAFSFCDADEILPNGTPRDNPRNLRIKRLLVNTAFAGRHVIQAAWRKRILLGFGNPILCPTVTINRAIVPDFAFREDLRTNMDWLAWIALAKARPVLKLPGTLMHRRVHAASETASCLADGTRLWEDNMVFQMLWPRPVAATIMHFYRAGYTTYLQ